MDKVALLIADQCEETEAITVVDYLRRAEISIDLISITGDLTVKGAHGINFQADFLIDQVELRDYDYLVFTGGLGNAKALASDDRVLTNVQAFFRQGKRLTAICAAPLVFEAAGLADKIKGTAFPGILEQIDYQIPSQDLVVIDSEHGIITSRGPATALCFALALVTDIAGQTAADQLGQELLVPEFKASHA